MRVAPPVQALSCSAGPWRGFHLTLYALSAAVAVAWAAAQLWGAGMAAGGAAAAALAVVAIGRRWRAQPASRLAWDGAAWVWYPPRGEALAGQARLMIDLGSWMLVRFVPGAHWLPLSRRDAADWQALRVALHAAPPSPPGA